MVEDNDMAIVGFIRHTLLKKEKSPELQSAEFGQTAEKLGGSLEGVFVDRGPPDPKTAILSRPACQEMLEYLRAEDVLLVSRLEHLGNSMRDVWKTMEALVDHGVRIYALHALNGELDLEPDIAKVILQLFALWAIAETGFRHHRRHPLIALVARAGQLHEDTVVDGFASGVGVDDLGIFP
jgi:DNA invertase Pin-like site-specific DNA recombinase